MPLLFRLLLIVVSLAAYCGEPITAGQSQTAYNAGACQASTLHCGDVDVHYPFFLANDSTIIDGTAYSYCGYPGMEIICEAGRATLRLKDSSYTVLAIDYDRHTVTVADADVLDGGGGGCPRHNVSVPVETWLNLSTTANEYLNFFFGCAFTAATPPPPPILPIDCSGFPGQEGGLSSYVAVQADVPHKDKDTWPRACKEVVVAPVLKELLLISDDEYLPRLNSDGYGKLLEQGFQLTWDPTAGPCFVCEDSGGQCSYNQSGEFIGCLCSDGGVRGKYCGSPRSEKKKITAYIVSAVTGAVLLSVLLSVCALYHNKFQGTMFWKRSSKHAPSIESFLEKHGAWHPKRYTYSEVKIMTKSFAHKLGQGGSGAVYKGILPNEREVAVKLLKSSKDDGQGFMNEIAIIMRTSHVNVVSLLGYCLQGSKRALIYEYMPNGSLERFAFGQNSKGENSLSWEKLFDITVGIARGLEYLHRGCSTRIVHFDIKPHNILLDKDFCPKISDFGLAKLCAAKESIISIDGARGTIGYIAPEVFSQRFGEVSSKSDVYSYGMMVLEMVGARKNINNNSETSSNFPQWFYEHLDAYCVNAGEISIDTEVVRKLIVVGLWCIQLQPINRPSMTRVIEMLVSGANDLEIPPQSLLC